MPVFSVFPSTLDDGSVYQLLGSTKVIHKLNPRPRHFIPWKVVDEHGRRLILCNQQDLSGDYCRQCKPDSMVFLAHRDCWKVAFATNTSDPDHSLFWSRLASQSRPFEIHVWAHRQPKADTCHQRPALPTLAVLALGDDLFHADTSLGRLLSKVYRLPLELQLQILGLLRETMLYSLLQTKVFVTEMLPRLPARSDWTLQPTTMSLPQVDQSHARNTLSCRTTTTMGRSYLSELALGLLADSTAHMIIVDKPVRGLQFALGRLGIRGVRISYGDSTFSPWVGEYLACWLGTVRCCDLSKINIISDVSDSPRTVCWRGPLSIQCRRALYVPGLS